MGKNQPCVYPWREVAAYSEAGHSRKECQLRFGFSQAAWKKAILAGRLHLTLDRIQRQRLNSRGNPIYDWALVQRRHNEGRSRLECMEEFGFSYPAWVEAVRRRELIQREWANKRALRAKSVEEILKSTSRWSIKRALLKLGVLENRCDECGIFEWRGKPLAIQIDHRNGIKDDHRLENLRMLCPNCHSQTETYGAKNRKLKRTQVSFLITEAIFPGRQAVRQGPLKPPFGGSNPSPGAWPYRLAGLGRRPLTAVTRVRIPLGLN